LSQAFEAKFSKIDNLEWAPREEAREQEQSKPASPKEVTSESNSFKSRSRSSAEKNRKVAIIEAPHNTTPIPVKRAIEERKRNSKPSSPVAAQP
jgi:hypothetical protein